MFMEKAALCHVYSADLQGVLTQLMLLESMSSWITDFGLGLTHFG
jgi:hypothetical protein